MGISLVELVDRLIDIGPYDQPSTSDTDPPGEEEDTEDSTTIKSKLPKEEEFEEDNGSREETLRKNP